MIVNKHVDSGRKPLVVTDLRWLDLNARRREPRLHRIKGFRGTAAPADYASLRTERQSEPGWISRCV